jgi:hypothetical protein
MVTSLVTSRPGTARTAGATVAGSRLRAGLIGACAQATHESCSGPRGGALTRAGEPARTRPDAGEPQSVPVPQEVSVSTAMIRALHTGPAIVGRDGVRHPLRRAAWAVTGRLCAIRERRLVTRQCTSAPAYRTASARPGTGLNLGAPSAPAGRLLSGTATSRPTVGHDRGPRAASGRGSALRRALALPMALSAHRPLDVGEASR